MFNRLRALLERWRERRYRHPVIPRGMQHIEGTMATAAIAERYEQAGREEFDRRVAESSGTRGWETFSLLVLLAGGLVSTVLVTLNGLLWLTYALGAFSSGCVALLFGRWWVVRLRRRYPRIG